LASAPVQVVKCALWLSLSVTVACLTTELPVNPRPATSTCCVLTPVLVTVTDQRAVAPGLPT